MSQVNGYLRLFRPVGLKELELIALSGWKEFPPRLFWQPIFYPVLNFEYAKQIAFEWNTIDEASSFSGFVTEFEVEEAFLSKYEVQNVGGFEHNELWIPAEDLAEMNRRIAGEIQVTAAYYGTAYKGLMKDRNGEEKTAKEVWEILLESGSGLPAAVRDFATEIRAHYNYWQLMEMDTALLLKIRETWESIVPGRLLPAQTSLFNG